MKHLYKIIAVSLVLAFPVISQKSFETDTVKTSNGDLLITFIGHGTLMFEYNNIVVHVDPVEMSADYSEMEKADLILITHHHGDHFNMKTINELKKENTIVLLTKQCSTQYPGGIVLYNGDEKSYMGIEIKAVPAYNIINKRDNGEVFHPEGTGNGYLLTVGDKEVYIAGDTENIHEMKELNGIDIAFIPMNLPYTMTPLMAADAVNMLNPKICYPYHFGKTDLNEFLELLKDKKDCEIRIRSMQ